MKFIFLTILFWQSAFASLSPEWKLIESFGVEEAYQNVNDSTSILTVFKEKDHDVFKLENFDLQTYISAIPEVKSFIHGLVGISDWKISWFEKSVLKNNMTDVLLVKLKGTYLRNGKDVVEFEEWHYFYETNFLQLMIIRNKTEASLDASSLLTTLQSKWL